MYYSIPKGYDMTIFLFLIHRFCGYFRKLKKGLLAPFSKDDVFIIIVLFKIDVRRATLIDDPFNVLAIDLVNVRQDPL